MTTEEVSRTRGAESYAAIETLRRHGLVAVAESRGPSGKATRWRSPQRFLDRLGLRSLEQLARQGAGQTLLADRKVARKLTAKPDASQSEDYEDV